VTAITTSPCAFCAIVAGIAPAVVVRRWPHAIAIRPLDPVTDGHLLIIPTVHVRDLTDDPEVTAATMHAASELAQPPCNIIASAGHAATQTVFHLHIHLVPRHTGDGLTLPWAPHPTPSPLRTKASA
jgi:histidine triad (HIT) family protein